MRSIPDPGFPGDDGGADPAVVTALAAYDVAPEEHASTAHHAALAVLQETRVLVPVMAVPFLLWSWVRLRRARRRWVDASQRARVVVAVAA